jgi:hypothetical protein
MSSSGASRRAGARAHLPFSRLVSALDRAVDGVPATALRDTIALATSWTVVFAAVSVLVAIVCFGRANASERGWSTSLAYALAGSVNATLAVGALAGLGYCRRGWRARMSMAGDAAIRGGRHEAARGVEMVKVCGNCDAPFPVQQPVAHKFRCARCGLTSRKPKQRPLLDSGTDAAPAEAADAPRSPKRFSLEKAAADAERRAAAKAEKESRKQRLRLEAREREAAEDAQRRELQTLVENARAAKEETRRNAEAAEAAREAAEKEKEKAAAELAKTRAEMDKAEEETTERKQVDALPRKSVPAPLASEAKEKAPGEIRAGEQSRRADASASRVKTIPAPRAAPVPAPRQTVQTAQTVFSGAKKPEKGGLPAPKSVPAPRVPGSAEALKSNPGNPGLGNTQSAPSMHAPQNDVPVPVPVGGTDTRGGGGGASNTNGVNTELLAVDFDPPLPPMAPMAPAPAWTGPTSLAPNAPGLGLSPGESPRAAPGPYEQRVTASLTPAADAREAFDPLGGARSWLGAGAGFMNLIQEPPAPRAGGTASPPVPGQPPAAARTTSPSLAPRRVAPPGMPPLVAPPAPPPPPGAPPPLPSGPPPPSARIAGRRYPPPPPAAPPLPPMPHPARTTNAFGGGIFGGFSSSASLGGVAGSGGSHSHSFRRSASDLPRHERFDSDEFSAEGRELEDELMALTGGLMHLDDDDDDASAPPKPEEDAAEALVTSTPSLSPLPEREETSVSPVSAESPAPRVSEAMTRSVSKIRAAASEGRAVPTEFFCSITHDVMVDPVIAWDGYTYERVSVARWLAKHSTSPMTGAPMPDFTLRPNHSMRSQMIGFAERL